jgi:LysR family glycine cleavage system transcriptional activator
MSEMDWRSIPPLASLRAFDLTSRHGNFAAAARSLNVTHAAIAQQVRTLEASLGIALTRREGRTVTLTGSGTELADHLNAGFDRIAEGVRELKKKQVERPLQITVTPFIAQSVILPRLKDFWQQHPNIQVSMMPSQELVDFVSLGFDLAIRARPDRSGWPGLDAELLLDSPLVIVGTPALVKEFGHRLDQAPWIWTPGTTYEENRLRAFGLVPEELETISLGSDFIDVSAALQGLGLMVLPEILVAKELASGRIAKAPAQSPYSVHYYAVTAKGRQRPQVRAFIDWLQSTITDYVGQKETGRNGSR